VWSFAGVRSLYDDGSKRAQDVTRDYVLTLEEPSGEAPLLTVYGGKITTYRRLAEEAYGKLAPVFGARPDWTKGAPLPGGDFDVDGIERLIAGLRLSYPFLSEGHARRLARAYGTRVRDILASAKSLGDLGPNLGADLTAAEVRYLMAHEWAQTPDDVLWRRTKLGLRVSRDERARLSTFMTGALGNAADTNR
jgi:glycerol-3-phosphate dehydrogenase